MAKRRVTNEAYFTSAALAGECLADLAAVLDLDEFDLIVEPSAGDGAFLDLLPQDRRIGIDLEPRRSDIMASDFLQWQPTTEGDRVLVLGNPPFGRRGALAVRFMTHAATFADVIAFILPRSFNKDTFQERVPSAFHLISSRNCDDHFLIDGRQRAVRTVFQVWQRGETPRPRIKRPSQHAHFTLRHAHLSRTSDADLAHLRNEYDFTIPQVGSRFAPCDVRSVERGSHWFVKAHVPDVRETFERLDFTFLADMNVAHTSLSKADIVQAYESAVRDPGI